MLEIYTVLGIYRKLTINHNKDTFRSTVAWVMKGRHLLPDITSAVTWIYTKISIKYKFVASDR